HHGGFGHAHRHAGRHPRRHVLRRIWALGMARVGDAFPERRAAVRAVHRDRPVRLFDLRRSRGPFLGLGGIGRARIAGGAGRSAHDRRHAEARAQQPARGGLRAGLPDVEGDHARHLPGGAHRNRHRHPARRRTHQRRDRAAALHLAQQSVLVGGHEPAAGEPAGGDLPVRDEPVRGLAPSRLGRRGADHACGAGAQHRRPACFQENGLAAMAELMNPVSARPKLQVRNLQFYYGSFHALKNISMDIPERMVTAFIGPSGCGKSTLLRTLNKMYALYPEQRAEGEILMDGENLLRSKQDVSLIRARIGMVFQKPTPFPMSIYDNIAFGVRLFENLPMREMDDRVEWALMRAALWDEVKGKLRQSGDSLSGGQQQRLCIARGIAIKPEVLLLDEPCSALDPISTAKIEELIHELKSDYTVVIVTHNMQQAARVSDYTAYMY